MDSKGLQGVLGYIFGLQGKGRVWEQHVHLDVFLSALQRPKNSMYCTKGRVENLVRRWQSVKSCSVVSLAGIATESISRNTCHTDFATV